MQRLRGLFASPRVHSRLHCASGIEQAMPTQRANSE